jgi:lipopolysaccharide/colanic/teichoic acid biosynthesis glycosyltransferase
MTAAFVPDGLALPLAPDHLSLVPMPAPDVEYSHPLRPHQRAFKRALDILLAGTLLLLTIPLLVVAALAVKLESRGPALFCHPRLGFGGRPFKCYKLRTMRAGADDEAHRQHVAAMIRGQAKPENGLFKLASNPRITPLGRIIRKLSIDELPQLWNVLRGEMSVVGPRPPVLEEAAAYTSAEWRRLVMKPGLTGLAQLRGRSGLRFDLIVAADLEYAQTWTPLLELRILARTPYAVLSGRGAV